MICFWHAALAVLVSIESSLACIHKPPIPSPGGSTPAAGGGGGTPAGGAGGTRANTESRAGSSCSGEPGIHTYIYTLHVIVLALTKSAFRYSRSRVGVKGCLPPSNFEIPHFTPLEI